jgi:hypothetical protein
MPKTIVDPDVRSSLSFRILLLTHRTERRWGTMNAGQMLRHVAVGMEQALGKQKDVDASNILLRTVGRIAILRILPKFPRGLPTSDAMRQTATASDPSEFESDRERVLALLEEQGAWPRERHMPDHPALGPLTHAERGILTWKHLDHHLRQFGV